MSSEEPTQLDRIEAKLDEIITHVKPQVIYQMPQTDADRAFAEAFRVAVKAQGNRPKSQPKWGGLRTAAAIAGGVIVSAAVIALMVCLWALVAQVMT